MANKKLNQLVTKPSIASGDLFPIADATTGQLYKTTISDLGTAIGSGVSSVNGLVGAVVLDTDDIQELASPVNKWFTDLRARAAISVSSPLAYNSGTGLITIAQATGSANGYLSSTDWTTFNSKQAALSGTGFVKISGTTISYDNSTYLTTSAAATNYVPYTGATANVNLGLNYSLTAALIIKSGGTSTQFLKADGSIDTNTYLTTGSAASTYLPLSGGTISGDLTISSTNPRIYLTDTDNNPDYFISNTDGTFTIYDVTSSVSRFTLNGTTGTFGGNLTVGSIIKSGGTSFQFLKADGSVDSTAYLPLAGGTLTGALFATSASFSGYVGFGGNTSPLAAIDVTGAGKFSSSVTASSYIVSGGTSSQFLKANGTLDSNTYLTTSSASSTYLPLSGGTLTGALSGTSASFSGLTVDNNQNGSTWVIAKNQNAGSGAAAGFLMTNNTGDLGAISLLSSGNSPANGLFIRTLSTNSLILGTNSTANLTIASGGAATFSSSVTATKIALNTTVSSSTLEVLGTNSQWAGSFTGNSSASGSYGVVVAAGTNANDIAFRVNNAANSSTYFNVRGDGAATFSSSVTANSSFNGFQSGTQNLLIDWSASSQITTLTYTELFFGTNAQRRMTITSSGNVGIGTSSPSRNLDINGNLRVQSGAIDLSNDFNNQIYSLSNAFYIKTNGSEKMVVTSSGNVGIGTTSPFAVLTSQAPSSGAIGLGIVGRASDDYGLITFRKNDAATTVVEIGGNTASGFFFNNYANTFTSFATNGSERMRITSSGSVGIGTTSPQGGGGSTDRTLSINSGAGAASFVTGLVGDVKYSTLFTASSIVVLETNAAIPLAFNTNATERMRITSGGNILVGTTTDNGIKFQVSGDIYSTGYVYFKNQASSNNFAIYGSTNILIYNSAVGNIANINASTGIYVATSDINKKKDFEDSTIGLNEVMQLKPTLYRMKSESEDGENQLGFIAQEVQGIIPSAYQQSGDFIGLNFNPIVAALTKAVQELKAELDTLKNK